MERRKLPRVTEEEIKMMLKLGRAEGTVEMDEEVLCNRVFKLNDVRAVEPLIEALKDDNKYVREAAASALGRLNDARGVKPLLEAGKELNKWKEKKKKFEQMILEMGFPSFFNAAALPPFDIISHGMRGLNGTVMDMYRQPDKIIA